MVRINTLLLAILVALSAASMMPTAVAGKPDVIRMPPADPLLGSIRFYSAQELYGVQQSVFEMLFQEPWEEAHWEYPLSVHVGGTGVYEGTNHLGQVFELEVLAYGAADLTNADLTHEQRQWALQNDFHTAVVLGELRREDTRILVHGDTVTTRRVDGSLHSRFWLNNTLASGGAFSIDHSALPRAYGPVSPPPRVRSADHRLLRQDCASACVADRDQRVADANTVYQMAVDSARQQRDSSIQQALQSYSIEKNRLDSNLANSLAGLAGLKAGCTLGCAFTGPGALLCVLGCAGSYATLTALAYANYSTDLSAAAQQRDNSISAAHNAFAVAEGAAAAARDFAIEQAQRDFARCIAACGGGGGGNEDGPRVAPPIEPE